MLGDGDPGATEHRGMIYQSILFAMEEWRKYNSHGKNILYNKNGK